MAKFKIPVTWEVCGVVEVESETLEDAVRYFEENSDNIPLPSDSEYVDGSFGLSCNDIDFIKTFNQQERNDLLIDSIETCHPFWDDNETPCIKITGECAAQHCCRFCTKTNCDL